MRILIKRALQKNSKAHEYNRSGIGIALKNHTKRWPFEKPECASSLKTLKFPALCKVMQFRLIKQRPH